LIGIDYLNRLAQLLNDAHPSGYWIDKKLSFDLLFEAAKNFASDTRSLHSTQTITTVATQAKYTLMPNFLRVLTEDSKGKETIPYNNGTSTTWLSLEQYPTIVYDDMDDSTPYRFAITDRPKATQITGTATSSGTNAGGSVTLTDTNAAFTSLVAGDSIYNTTSSYIGYVLSVTSATVIKTAMFNLSAVQSAYGDWTSSDAYIIQPSARYDLVLDPPPDTSGHTIALEYVCSPDPVYTDYGSYGFASGYEEALLKYAAWLYKYRDLQPKIGDALYKAYDMQMRKARSNNRSIKGMKRVTANFTSAKTWS
jgi:hypothetical protein